MWGGNNIGAGGSQALTSLTNLTSLNVRVYEVGDKVQAILEEWKKTKPNLKITYD